MSITEAALAKPTELEFVEPPEVKASDVAKVLRLIRFRKRWGRSSFGARVVREGGQATFDEIGRLLQGPAPEDFNLLRDRDYGPGGGGPLHRDSDKINDVTEILVKAGELEAIVLAGSTYGDIPNVAGLVHPRFNGETDELFSKGLFRGASPSRSYKTTLKEDDVIIFDHSQTHAFRSITEDRFSTSRYLVPLSF